MKNGSSVTSRCTSTKSSRKMKRLYLIGLTINAHGATDHVIPWSQYVKSISD